MGAPGFVNRVTGNGHYYQGEEIMKNATDIAYRERCKNYRTEGALDQTKSGDCDACFIDIVQLVVLEFVKFQFGLSGFLFF